MNDKVVSALVGLIGACANNGKAEHTDAIVLNALLNCFSEVSEEQVVDEIIKEKYEIAPNCATCSSPCGNTSDYDMRKFYDNTALKAVKEESLRAAADLAERIYTAGQTELPDIIYKAISFFGYELAEDSYRSLTETLIQTEV